MHFLFPHLSNPTLKKVDIECLNEVQKIDDITSIWKRDGRAGYDRSLQNLKQQGFIDEESTVCILPLLTNEQVNLKRREWIWLKTPNFFFMQCAVKLCNTVGTKSQLKSFPSFQMEKESVYYLLNKDASSVKKKNKTKHESCVNIPSL